MREILNRSNPFELNAIFIQPSRFCKLDCKGCYVKEHTGGEDSYHMPIELWKDLFKKYLYDIHSDYHTNQITFSADDYSKDPIKKQYMEDVFEEYYFWICAGKAKYDKSLLPEAHITFHTLNTFYSYKDEILRHDPLYTKRFTTIFDMISFSEIKLSELDTIKELLP